LIRARVPPRYRTRQYGQRLPAGNGPSALSGLCDVGDAGKQPAQLDGGRQLAALFEGGADRGSLYLGYDEHLRSMGTRTTTGKRRANDTRKSAALDRNPLTGLPPSS
jgi:hypothetical protein